MSSPTPLPDEASDVGVPGCPARKTTPAAGSAEPTAQHLPGQRRVVRTFEAGRGVLRDSTSVRQAGFGAERVERNPARMRPPILYLEGTEHRRQRHATARFFAPKVIESHREMMQTLSRELIAQLRRDRTVDLSDLSLQMSMGVVSRIVGLTNSSPRRMGERLDAFFVGQTGAVRLSPRSILRAARTHSALLRFFYLDVRPAIAARRRRRSEDVISELLDQGFSDLEILTECVTYAAAGMATTREFLVVAAWHLLDDPGLLSRYRRGETEERLEILHEILRLEPVVGQLYRRTTAPLTLTGPDGDEQLPSGSLVVVDLYGTNVDPATAGPDALQLCPGRTLPRSVPPTLLSFGDGHHKCPGGPLAIMESEIFLTELLRRDVVADGPPRIRWNPISAGYNLDRFRVRVRA